ncbi:MAG: FAD-dependent oxidoreductase [Bacilli bacterium]|nr:FAD-dependent oxidoreductase [Bacilli bacterium]
MIYDAIIIGMGVAGMSAAIYAKRSGKNILILEKKQPGGILNSIDKIENYPGVLPITGPNLALNLFNQLNLLEVPYKLEEVTKITLENKLKIVKTNQNAYQTKNILIATGRSPIMLNLPNENELLGKGISTCALCDGALYKEKDIALVGNNNRAIEESIFLSELARKVYVIIRGSQLNVKEELQNKLKMKENIILITNSVITEIKSQNNYLYSIILNQEEELEINGLFLNLGYTPKLEFAKDLDITNTAGYIEVNDNYETNISGIYAAGDIIQKKIYQVVTAAAEGASAAIRFSRK